MVIRSRTCDPRRLDLFFQDRLPEGAERELETHLGVCPSCRRQLDQRAGGPRWWTEVRRHLSEFSASDALGFLEPSSHPSSLGRLGGYEVLEVLGRGGMGMVLKAFDATLNRSVAIKVLIADYAASGTARKRFAREAQAAAAVSHDHVVPVHAVDAQATPPYLVMAYIPGQSLQERVDRSGPLDTKEILRIGTQTAAGLAAAHAQGLVHRDVKPANIMLENGMERVRITDFGLARAVDDVSVTQSGMLAGTPQYMAPEQARGDAVDQRADLFALGSTLYFIATGQAPFRGENGMAVIRQVCDVEPPSIRVIEPDVPLWLEGIIRKLHAKNPAERFQSAAEVATLLEQCLAHVQQPDHLPLPARAAELGKRLAGTNDWAEARRVGWVGGVVFAALLAMAALSYHWWPRATNPSNAAIETANFDEEFQIETTQIRGRLDAIQQELSIPAAPQVPGLEEALANVRGRAEMLSRDLGSVPEPGPDALQVQTDSIRQRIELLRKDLGAGPD
jgi:eukaryotic-like serine/threonine-protein kinase